MNIRSDAQRNRDLILDAALDVFVEQGPDAPLEAISKRAGTGIATLYRRFPDRQALMRAVVLNALNKTLEEARRAAAEEPGAFKALVRYMHRALDTRVAAVIPALMESVPLDDGELADARRTGTGVIQGLIDAAHREGSLRSDVNFGDIGTLVVRLSRPLPGPFPREVNDNFGHRHLDLLIDGLRSSPAAALAAGTGMTLEDLHAAARPPARDA